MNIVCPECNCTVRLNTNVFCSKSCGYIESFKGSKDTFPALRLKTDDNRTYLIVLSDDLSSVVNADSITGFKLRSAENTPIIFENKTIIVKSKQQMAKELKIFNLLK